MSGSTGQQGPFLGLNTSTEACQLEAQVRILGFTIFIVIISHFEKENLCIEQEIIY